MAKPLHLPVGAALARAMLTLALLAHCSAVSALTYGRPQPDPWFTLWVQVEAASLPQGVEFRRASFPEGDLGHFSNAGATPFYLVTAPSPPPNWVRDLPATVVPEAMAVSGVAYRMEAAHAWLREPFPGILVERFLKTGDFRMDAYLGKKKIELRGRLVRGPVNRLELDAPLPEPLRLAEVAGQPGRFAIANTGRVPLYTGVAFPRPVGWVREVPFGFLATHKVFKGKAYYGQSTFPSTADGWQEVEPHDARLTPDEFEYYLPGFKTLQVRRDNRPADTVAPEPQPFEMTVFHGREKVTIRGRILYDLNMNYDPQASRRPPGCASCTGAMCDKCAKDQRRPQSAGKLPKREPTY